MYSEDSVNCYGDYMENPSEGLRRILNHKFYLVKIKVIGGKTTNWISATPDDVRLENDRLWVAGSYLPFSLIEEFIVRYKDECNVKRTSNYKVSYSYLFNLLSTESQEKLMTHYESK